MTVCTYASTVPLYVIGTLGGLLYTDALYDDVCVVDTYTLPGTLYISECVILCYLLLLLS